MLKLSQISIALFLSVSSFAQVSNLGTNTLTSGGTTTTQAAAPIIDPLPLPPNVIVFDYDNAGNQIRRRFIYVAAVAPRMANPVATPVTAEKLLTTDLYEDIKYYPNPVKSELYLKWSEVENKDMQTIELYDLNGRMLRRFPNQSNQENITIDFESFPAGYYNVLLLYSTDAPKTLKIVKQ